MIEKIIYKNDFLWNIHAFITRLTYKRVGMYTVCNKHYSYDGRSGKYYIYMDSAGKRYKVKKVDYLEFENNDLWIKVDALQQELRELKEKKER